MLDEYAAWQATQSSSACAFFGILKLADGAPTNVATIDYFAVGGLGNIPHSTGISPVPANQRWIAEPPELECTGQHPAMPPCLVK